MRRLPAHMPAEATSCPRLHRKKTQQPHMDPNDPHGMRHRDDVQASHGQSRLVRRQLDKLFENPSPAPSIPNVATYHPGTYYSE